MEPSIETYRDLPEDELDIMMGEAIFQNSLASKPISKGEKQALGKRWFEARLNQWKIAICSDAGIAGWIIGPKNKDRNLLFATVLDALLRFEHFSPVPVGVLAAKLVHYGVDRLCHQAAAPKQ